MPNLYILSMAAFSCNHMVHRAYGVYYLVLYRKSCPTSNQKVPYNLAPAHDQHPFQVLSPSQALQPRTLLPSLSGAEHLLFLCSELSSCTLQNRPLHIMPPSNFVSPRPPLATQSPSSHFNLIDSFQRCFVYLNTNYLPQ